MAMWENPETRKIDGKIYKLVGEGLEKPHALINAKGARKAGLLARVIEDERMGRYDVKNRGPYYLRLYSREKIDMTTRYFKAILEAIPPSHSTGKRITVWEQPSMDR